MTILDDLYTRWNEHDVDGVLAFFTEDLSYTDKTIGMTFEGPEQLGQFMAGSFVSLPDVRFEVLRSFETETDCAAEALMSGTFAEDLGGVKATGGRFSIPYAIVGRKVDGKISELNDYWNFTDLVGGA